MSIAELVEISRRYGGDPDFVLGGGGNTSWKDEKRLFVKASGISLADIDERGFVELDLGAVKSILEAPFPSESSTREAQVLETLLDARIKGQRMRPSVETILHALFPYAYIVHTHPSLVNGLLCAVDSRKETERLFGAEVLWLPYTTPGYVLSTTLRDAFLDMGKRGTGVPRIVFLQNHGVFVAAETIGEIDSLYDGIMETIGRAAADAFVSVGALDTSASARPAPRPEAAATAEAVCAAAIRSLAPGGFITFETGGEIDRFVASASAFAPLDGAFTPDHIVYAGARPLFVRRPIRDEDLDSSIEEAWRAFARDEGFSPRIVAVQGIGIFAVGKTEKASALSMKLSLDAVKIARYATAFGGPRHMRLKDAEFIKKWEVEQYRASVASR